MVKITEMDSSMLQEAVLLWTGYKNAFSPAREEQTLKEAFSPEDFAKLMQAVTSLEDDFYKSKAHITAANLEEMAEIAEVEFQAIHPSLPKMISEAFAWCYTFDYK